MLISASQRRVFDDVLDGVIASLPAHLHEMLEEVPLVVEDEAEDELLYDLGMDPEAGDELFGLHSGIPLTERSVEHSGTLPDHMMIFRGPILRAVGGSRRELERQVRITVLHEIGHHFGLDEDDLEALGYG